MLLNVREDKQVTDFICTVSSVVMDVISHYKGVVDAVSFISTDSDLDSKSSGEVIEVLI